MAASKYHSSGNDIRNFLQQLDHRAPLDEGKLAQKSKELLDAYAERLERADLNRTTIAPARYAMAVLMDTAICKLPNVRASAWHAAAQATIFDGRVITVESLKQFAQTAAGHGPDYSELGTFLNDTLLELEQDRQTRKGGSTRMGPILAGAFFLYLTSMVLYAVYLDYRFHSELTAEFQAEIASLPKTPSPEKLDAVGRLYHETVQASMSAPLYWNHNFQMWWDSARQAEEIYRQDAAATLPNALHEAIGEALATEGESIDLYDTTRAWRILTGRSDWSPSYLAGWIHTRATDLGLGNLAEHVPYLNGPEPRLAIPDPELFEQALDFAAEARETERVYLELTRLPEIHRLAEWHAKDHITEFEDVFIFRSGRSFEYGIPGIFTLAGWERAKDEDLDDAIRIARIEATQIFSRPGSSQLNIREEVLNQLQDETVLNWQTWLEDLRIRPFTDRRSAIAVSGALSRRNSALKQVIESVWVQAGGDDPTRPVQNKNRIEATLGSAVVYVRTEKLDQMRSIFSSLNVALSTLELDEGKGIDALLSIQDKTRAGAVLEEAPTLVAQIAEDLLAQTSATHANVLSNPLTREWQARVYPVCRQAIDGRYPFSPTGADAGLTELDAFFGPAGALRRFYAQSAERNLDATGETWRWSADARLSGLTPESAIFLQRSMSLATLLYANNQSFGTTFDAAPLAARGRAKIGLGGFETPLTSEGVTLFWPGERPLDGAEVSFLNEGSSEGMKEQGLWGLFRLLEQTNMRSRNGGQRQLVDLRIEGGRLFFELTFASPNNPIAARQLFEGLTCPPVL